MVIREHQVGLQGVQHGTAARVDAEVLHRGREVGDVAFDAWAQEGAGSAARAGRTRGGWRVSGVRPWRGEEAVGQLRRAAQRRAKQ